MDKTRLMTAGNDGFCSAQEPTSHSPIIIANHRTQNTNHELRSVKNIHHYPTNHKQLNKTNIQGVLVKQRGNEN